ncbi:hypothetical protein V490_07058 [Pseudogymnoascus sp. VKM F-3557]|nr:hypothetical protein V490_07058 [Pseudogymnoascus sp. VKM F-3557]
MVEPIGIALAAIAFIDPIYERANKLWKAYKTSEVFGEDFHRASVILQVNEVLFTAYLQSFNAYLQAKARADKWKQVDSRLRVKDLIESMVNDFDRSYNIIKKYTKADPRIDTARLGKQKGKGKEGLQPVSPTIQGSSSAQTEDPPPYPDQNPHAPRIPTRRWGRSGKTRLSESRSFLGSITKALSRTSSTTSHNSSTSSAGISSISTTLTTPSEAPLEGVEVSTAKTSALDEPSTSQDPVIASDSNLEQDDESQYVSRKDWKTAAELRQRLATFLEKISWVRNDKEEFERLVNGLYEMNQMLRDMLPKLENPMPFEKLRNGRERPKLWAASTPVREALESFNNALRQVNRTDGTRNLKITVRLEEDHDETRRLLEQQVPFFTRLTLRNNPLAFRLATYFEQPSSPNKIADIEVIVCSSIHGIRNGGISNLPAKLQAAKTSAAPESNEQFAEVGQLSQDSENAWSVYREVTTPDSAWLAEQTLDDFVDHTNFTPTQRIYLAAKIAVAHLHFAAINRGFAFRKLENYRYFRQFHDDPHDWTIPFVSFPWLDYGFGSPVKSSGRIRLNAPAQQASAKIDPAIELGVLLYQITGSTKVPYNNVAELKEVGLEAAKTRSMDKVTGVCGLPVMEIVETCFRECPDDDRVSGGQDAAFVVIEEVAAALVYLANELRRKSDAVSMRVFG